MRLPKVAIGLMILVLATQTACTSWFPPGAAGLRAGDPAAAKTAETIQQLQGEWGLVSLRTNDERGCSEASLGVKSASKTHFRFKGDAIYGMSADRELARHFTIDAAKDPMWMDIELTDGSTLEAVFAVTADSLLLVLPEGERIASLDPGEREQHYVIYRLQRVEPRRLSFGSSTEAP